MIVVPGIDGGVPFAMSRSKMSYGDLSPCLRDSKCFFRWPTLAMPAENPPLDPRAPVSADGTLIKDYAYWLLQKTGHRYRLPSMAEWKWVAKPAVKTFEKAIPEQSGTCLKWSLPGSRQNVPSTPVDTDDVTYTFPTPESEASPNLFGLCNMQGYLGEVAVECDPPYCAGSLVDNQLANEFVLTQTDEGDVITLGQHHLGGVTLLIYSGSNRIDSGIRLVRYFPETLHKEFFHDVQEFRYK